MMLNPETITITIPVEDAESFINDGVSLGDAEKADYVIVEAIKKELSSKENRGS